MDRKPTVRRMVMFKHGVAYLERSGPAEGSFELSFKRDEMNDVLKSLAVWVARGEAKVGALAFEKPEDPEQALVERRLDLPADGALMGLLGALRGRRVLLETKDGRIEGEVIGIETTRGPEGAEHRTVVIRAYEGALRLVDLAAVRSLDLVEASSRADLAFFVDRRRAASSGENRTVHVALEGHAEDLRVSYVVPAPTWRVSYRLSRDGDTVLLMAWGIVHNPADEDLNDIELTLTTGQPVSFLIDLYNPKSVERVVVEESSRALAAAPTAFERAPMAPPPAPMAVGGFAPPMPAAAPMPARAMAAPAPPPQSMADALGAIAEGASTYADRGELFEYRVALPVSLKRGASAMVPLLGSKIPAKKERIWRDGAGPSPDLVLTFDNTSGAVLEEGPAVIYDESVYAGEAMVPYSARGVPVKLAFAKDLAVRCRRSVQTRMVVQGLRLTDTALVEEQRGEEESELIAESDHTEPVEVIFELPKQRAGRALSPESAKPFEETASYWRFRATAPPRGKTSVKVLVRWPESRRINYEHVSAHNLEYWLSNRFLDESTFAALSDVIAAWGEARELDARRARLEAEQQQVYTKQGKIAEQLRVLKEGGAEGDLRLRYVKELEEAQDRVNACDQEMRSLAAAAEAARKRAADRLRALTRR